MSPILIPGQIVISFNWYDFKKLRLGDLVIIKIQGKLMVKRIQKFQNKKIFVLGDNFYHSSDSRKYGFVSKDQIMGKVIYIF